MDVSDEELELFNKVRLYDYWITIFHGENEITGKTLFLKENTQPETIGKPIVFANRTNAGDVWVTYQLAEKDRDAKEMEHLLDSEFVKLGGKVTKIATQKKWEYFPHVKTRDLHEGFYRKLEAMQGKNGFYHIGGLMNFETTEHTAEYAKHLMEKNFPLIGSGPHPKSSD